jgi:hypothetical protein
MEVLKWYLKNNCKGKDDFFNQKININCPILFPKVLKKIEISMGARILLSMNYHK